MAEIVKWNIQFKKEFGKRTWVTSYANDVMAYIPTFRVLQEGGYEGQSSMAVYGLPADRWRENVEDLVNRGIKQLVSETKWASLRNGRKLHQLGGDHQHPPPPKGTPFAFHG